MEKGALGIRGLSLLGFQQSGVMPLTEKPQGERIAHLEGVVPELKEDVRDVKDAVQSLHTKVDNIMKAIQQDLADKAGRQSVAEAHSEIDRIQLAMTDKVSKEQLETAMTGVKADVKQVRDRMLLWTGSLAALFILGNWVVPKLIGLLFQ